MRRDRRPGRERRGLADAGHFAHFDVVGHVDRGRLRESGRAHRVGAELSGAHAAGGAVQSYALLIVVGVIGFLGYYLYLAHHAMH